MITIYSISLVINLVLRQHLNNSLDKIFVDLAEDHNTYYLYEDGFRFGITINSDMNASMEIDKSKITLNFTKIEASFDRNGNIQVNRTSRKGIKCLPETDI